MDRRDLETQLAVERRGLLGVLSRVDEEDANLPGVVGEWSVRDTVSHIVFWEEEAIRRLEMIAEGRQNEIRLIDEAESDDWNRRAVVARQSVSWRDLLKELDSVRELLLEAIGNCSDEDLESGEVPVSRWLPVFTYRHDAEHRTELLEWLGKPGR